ncbi:hypothetical protein GCM10009821_11840 [Aeromicrobium halocynthiae]|uniref:Flp pilus-assembly TadG-like N-terminal domain-containing protein n=1 Tax=Aeromicrobium halocynthiae TaxID=560557 RepID=A0ABN1ZYT3_9ACTN
MSRRRSSWFAAGRDERGSILPMTALMVTVVLGFTAFAVDLGLNRVAVRDMQSVADAVALDTARSPALSTCNATTLTQVANASLTRQPARIGRDQSLQVEPGRIDAAGTFTSASTACNAVRITSRTEVDYAFAPVIGTDSGTARRSAIGAQAPASVCFSAGTKALSLNSSASALGPVLDQVIKVNNLDVAGYTGLVDLKDLSVPIGRLTAELGIGTPDEVATTRVTLASFLDAAADVLSTEATATAVARATVLRSIAVRAGSRSFLLGDVLALGTTGTSALDASVNALDLVAASIVAANGTNALRVNQLDIALPLDLVNGSTQLHIIEPPQIACGPVGTVARTAQVRIDMAKDIRLLGLETASISMAVGVARGSAELTAVRCESPQRTTVQGTTGLASIQPRENRGNSNITVLGLSARLVGEVGERTDVREFPYPPAPHDLVQQYGGSSRIVIQAEPTGLISGLLEPIDNTLLDVVNALTGAVDLLVAPVLAALGIRVGTMDVTMLGTPRCNNVRLAG